MNMMHLFLIIYSVFTMNLLLQCALGIRGAAESKVYGRFTTMIKLGIIFTSTLILWFLFSKIISVLISGFFIYVLLFPVSYMVYEGLEYLLMSILLKKDTREESFISFPGGITALAVFASLNIALNFFEALLLSLGFILGILLVCLIIREIKRRASLEAVPKFLRGKPLVIISMGMLSLIFSVASLMVLEMINAK